MAEVGDTYGTLSVVELMPPRLWTMRDKKRRDAQVLARCECGSERLYLVKHLRSGRTRSCGCAGRRTDSRRIWANMIQRCTNPKNPSWPRYGGRGITVCDRWRSFADFDHDMGPCPTGHSIDRIDNDRGYEPENCRWTIPPVQRRNR